MFSIARSVPLLRGLKRAGALSAPSMRILCRTQPALSFLQLPKSYFSANENSQTDKDSHDDFKPKTKVDLDGSNVNQQIEEVITNTLDYI